MINGNFFAGQIQVMKVALFYCYIFRLWKWAKRLERKRPWHWFQTRDRTTLFQTCEYCREKHPTYWSGIGCVVIRSYQLCYSFKWKSGDKILLCRILARCKVFQKLKTKFHYCPLVLIHLSEWIIVLLTIEVKQHANHFIIGCENIWIAKQGYGCT